MTTYLGRLAGIVFSIHVFVMAGSALSNEPAEIVRWDRAPIPLILPVGKERYIWFPGRVQPGIPPELVKKLRVQAVNDTIYIQAKAAFETTRLPVRDLTNGDFYLFDVKTSPSAPTTPLRLVKVTGKDEEALIKPAGDGDDSDRGVGYVKLTRFAAQHVYAPKRLATQEPEIFKVPLPADQVPLAGLYGDGDIKATPIASWRGKGGLYVTAVSVTNATKETMTLDPRHARGKWLTATFHHRSLGPSGGSDDTSTLYLISDRPFLEVVEQWLG